MVLDLINATPEKDSQGEKYVVVKLSNSVNKFLNQFLNDHKDCRKGDADDEDKQELRQGIKDALLANHRLMNPS